jgi:hypothetical protein
MNSASSHRPPGVRALPLLLAVALLSICGGVLLNSKPPDAPPRAVASLAKSPHVPWIAEPTLPAPLPGVFSLPPATLAGNAGAVAAIVHKTPPPASRDSFTFADLQAQLPQGPDGQFLMEVPTLYFSAGDAAARQVIEGQTVEITAQLTPDPANPALATLCRSLTRCCSADARRYTTRVEFTTTCPAFPADTWVTVTGKVHYFRDAGGYGTVVQVETLHEAKPPAQVVLNQLLPETRDFTVQ